MPKAKYWTHAEVDELLRRVDAGETLGEVGRALNRSEGAAYDRLLYRKRQLRR